MRATFDLSPLLGASIGFDRVFDLLENVDRADPDTWPPYDIVKLGEDRYRISMAVAGFSRDQLAITHEPNLLIVAGRKTDEKRNGYLHRGIADRPFERRFQLADYVKVTEAALENGLLTIDLERELPEEMKPRRIEVTASKPVITLHQAETASKAA